MGTLLGPLLALGSALSWGVADFAGGMYSRRYPSAAVVGVSQAWSFVALLIVLVFVGAPEGLGWLPWSVLAGVAGSVGLVAFYRALAFGTVGVVSPISALGAAIPVMVGLFGGEEPRTGQLVGIGLALLGAVLASGPELRGEEPVKAQAIGFAALAAAGLGIAMLAIARGSAHSALMTLTGMRATSVVGFVVAAVLLRTLGGIRARDLPGLALLGVTDLAANALLGVATTLALLSVTTVLAALYPVFTVALAAVVLHERMRPVQIAGTLAAIAGVALIAAG